MNRFRDTACGRHVGFGDGVYVSHDGGKSFKNMGLKESEHISKIIVDPRDSDVVYVASQGPLWSSGGERGLYKTEDGGETWKLILKKGPWTGVTDVTMDPRNSDVLYAVTHQRHRTVWGIINGGPESDVFKSTDAGSTWTELKSGLPSEDKGKMSIAVSPQKSNVVYVTIELANRDGGVYRSYDFGASYQFVSNLPLTQFYKVAVSYEEPFYYIAGGTQDNYSQYGPARTRDNGIYNRHWRITIGGDGHDCAIDPENPNIIYCESQKGFLHRFDPRTGEKVFIRPQPDAEEDLRHNWDSPIEISPHSHTRRGHGFAGVRPCFRCSIWLSC